MDSKNITLDALGQYLQAYISKYREEFHRLTQAPPVGKSYPKIDISPFIYADEITCYLLDDAVILINNSKKKTNAGSMGNNPSYNNFIQEAKIRFLYYNPEIQYSPLLNFTSSIKNGILKVYYVNKLIESFDFNDCYQLPPVQEKKEIHIDNLIIKLYKFNLTNKDMRCLLTLGVLGNHFLFGINNSSDFGSSIIIKDMKFVNKLIEKESYYHYLQIFPHIEDFAWDNRNLSWRIQADLARDFLNAITTLTTFKSNDRTFLACNTPEADSSKELEMLLSQLNPQKMDLFQKAINNFELLLKESSDEIENKFQQFFKDNKIILDISAREIIPKPEFKIPENSDLRIELNKSSVIPDFISIQPNGNYCLIEIERPNKTTQTQAIHQTSQFSQANFQLREWEHYIEYHYQEIEDKFPKINVSSNRSFLLIIGRGQTNDILKKSMRQNEIVMTYDELLEKAKVIYDNLQNLQ